MLQQSNFKFFIKIVLLMLLQKATAKEFYSSISEMSKLVDYESHFLKQMDKFIAENENKLEYLKARLTEFERERDEANEAGSTYFESPLNKYLLTKRLTVDWERIENLMGYNAGAKSLKKLDTYKEKHEMPNEGELDGAIAGLLRLQDIYRLKTKDIAAGILQGVSYDTEFDARHCFDIGRYGVRENLPRLGHSWLVEALNRLHTSNRKWNGFQLVEEPLQKSEILSQLIQAKHKLGDFKGANETFVELLQLNPESEIFAKSYAEFSLENIEKMHLSVDLSDDHAPVPEDLLSTSQHERYKFTCSGHIKPDPSEERHLRCGYLTETHPFLTLAPLKAEELSHDPLLVLYHDVIADSEIAVVKELTSEKIQRATVCGVNGSMISPVRTSQFVFLPKTVHRVLQTIDERVEDMTNLNMIYAEDHQFANYGIGGHYAEHTDWFVPEHFTKMSLSDMGNRIATVLFYLTDVEQGGGTAFPYLKSLVMPKKGSAAFWHNLHASGEGDQRTLHGACPIIVGSKWVQNRWIRANNQDDRRPCETFDDRVYGPY